MSTDHFNQLTEAEAERLACLIEECGEVLHIAGKILRHGYESSDPTNPACPGNRALLTRELGDLTVMIRRMTDAQDIEFDAFTKAHVAKFTSQKYLHHQDRS